MTLVRLTTQARRVEGGPLIGRTSRFSTGRAVTALKTHDGQPVPMLENSTLARGTQLPGTICSPPISFPNVLGFARVSVLAGPKQLHRLTGVLSASHGRPPT